MVRVTLVFAQISLALGLAGCSSVVTDDRASRPIPTKLVADMTAKGMKPSDPIFVRIFKQESELEVWKPDASGSYALLKTYPICRWSGSLGPKKQQGDRQAPEGFYNVTARMMNPRSQYHLSFDLGFPNRLEKAMGYAGSALMVHGACTSAGCFAMSDDGVAEIYAMAREAFAGGQPSFQVQSLPFRMSPANLAAHRSNPNMSLWRNLKEGSDYFEVTKKPPIVASCERRYVFPGKEPASRMDPLGRCPALETDRSAEALVAAKHTRDVTEATKLALNTPAPLAYVDGGMHPAFRRVLRNEGPKRLSEMTSAGVEVSQPDAALKDPYSTELESSTVLSFSR